MRAVFYNLAIFYQVSAEKVGILGMDGTLYPVDETVLVDDGFPEKKTILINILEMSIKIQLVTFNVIQWHSSHKLDLCVFLSKKLFENEIFVSN